MRLTRCERREIYDPMSAELGDTPPRRAGAVRPFAWFLAKGLDGPEGRPGIWEFVRALALMGFVFFAAFTSFSWLQLNITKPFKQETIRPREIYASSPSEQDIALLRRWLPVEGKVGYLSERPLLQCYEERLRLAPLLLDNDWRKHDWVLVDFPVARDRALIESPSYRLVTDLPDAKAFARGMRINRRNP